MDILGAQHQGASGPGSIKIKIACLMETGQMDFDLSLDPKIPFNVNVQFILQQLFAQNIASNYNEQIEYKFQKQIISQAEKRTLIELGITTGDEIQMKLSMKGGF
ncbi:hypothetical protein pb186bvf_008268 [Paramecium bursaria]